VERRLGIPFLSSPEDERQRNRLVKGIVAAAFGAQWGGTWSEREGKWRWKAGTVDEGEHLSFFYRLAEEGSSRERW
jgi:hypothetical protein